jgi:molybdopterin converting factor small subunit|tara:strand:- start:651 stop:926 length:276 start_codon:yes stop_codon:yes gene_type:complete
VVRVKIQLKLYGPSKILSDKEIIHIEVPDNSNIDELRKVLSKIISKDNSKSNLKNLPKTAAFFSETNEIIYDNYKLKDKELISIIPPIGGG